MTISTQTASVTYTGNGVQTTFVYNFLIPYQADGVTPAAAVYIVEDDVAVLLPPADYTLTGVDSPLGGTVVYTPAISSSQQIRIDRALAYTQPNAFPNQGFLPESVEESLDQVVMMIQQVAASLGLDTTTAPQLESWPSAQTDETTVITTTGVYTTYPPWPYDFTITEVYASLTAASSAGDFTLTIKNNGMVILSTDITIDEGETSSLSSATQPVVSLPSLARGDIVTIEVTGVGASAAGLKTMIVGRQA